MSLREYPPPHWNTGGDARRHQNQSEQRWRRGSTIGGKATPLSRPGDSAPLPLPYFCSGSKLCDLSTSHPTLLLPQRLGIVPLQRYLRTLSLERPTQPGSNLRAREPCTPNFPGSDQISMSGLLALKGHTIGVPFHNTTNNGHHSTSA